MKQIVIGILLALWVYSPFSPLAPMVAEALQGSHKVVDRTARVPFGSMDAPLSGTAIRAVTTYDALIHVVARTIAYDRGGRFPHTIEGALAAYDYGRDARSESTARLDEAASHLESFLSAQAGVGEVAAWRLEDSLGTMRDMSQQFYTLQLLRAKLLLEDPSGYRRAVAAGEFSFDDVTLQKRWERLVAREAEVLKAFFSAMETSGNTVAGILRETEIELPVYVWKAKMAGD